MHHFEAMKSSNVHFTFFRMGKILEGLLAGAVEAEVPHGVECLRDAKHIWERFGGVIDQLKHASFNSVLHAVEDLGHIIHDVANELEECKAVVGTDLDKLREMSKAFTDPWYFIFHVEHDLIVNGQDVHHEIMDAEAQWENQHFYEFGHSVGLALSKIFLGGKMKNDIPRHYLPAHEPYGADHYNELYHHQEDPRVVHDTPVVHSEPVHHYPHRAEYHQEEPHVEFEHEAHSGPLHRDTHTVTPHHEHEYAATHAVHHEPVHHEPVYHAPVFHTDAHYYHEEPVHHEDTHYYREAAHHYYQ